jgi:Acetyltransferase (GNAT) domain
MAILPASVTVRPLRRDDLDRLYAWMNEPHLFPFYMRESMALESVVQKFTPRTSSGHPCHSLIAEIDAVPLLPVVSE